MVAFAVAILARQCAQILVEMLVAQSHFIAQGIAARDHAAPSLRAALPVIHIVLLEGPRRTEHPRARQPNGFLDFRRSGLVGKDPRPDFGPVRSPRVPDANGARGGPQHREVREYGANDGLDSVETRAEALLHLWKDRGLIGQDRGGRRIGNGIGADPDDAVAIAGGEHGPAWVRVDAEITAGTGLDRR